MTVSFSVQAPYEDYEIYFGLEAGKGDFAVQMQQRIAKVLMRPKLDRTFDGGDEELEFRFIEACRQFQLFVASGEFFGLARKAVKFIAAKKGRS